MQVEILERVYMYFITEIGDILSEIVPITIPKRLIGNILAAKIIVTKYIDNATGIMKETENGSGKFTEVTLNPKVIITDGNMIDKANELHKKANELCFIANSCNFKIRHKPNTIAE